MSHVKSTLDPTKNHEGYPDPTAYEAIKNVMHDDLRLKHAIREMQDIAHEYGFHVEERIVLKDKRTGRIHR
jgi:hypothetical protein